MYIIRELEKKKIRMNQKKKKCIFFVQQQGIVCDKMITFSNLIISLDELTN